MKEKLSVLHIFDDEKITKNTIELFLKIEDVDQDFVVLSKDVSKWVNIVSKENIITSDKELFSNKFIEKVLKYDVIFLQALSYAKAKLILKNRLRKKIIIWGLWGYDLYNFTSYYNKDKAVLTKTNKKGIIHKLRDAYTYRIVYKKAIKHINICLFLLKSDYDLLRKTTDTNAIWETNCYQTIEQINKSCENFSVEGSSILIGNSSTPSNRHEMIFEKITDCKDMEIICPLNYGDKNYGEFIAELGSNLFKEKFIPLKNFMEISDYLKLLKKCSIAIFAHKRQQAFGTILQMIYGGARVFLSNESPLYKYFIQNRFIIFSLENDLKQSLLIPLDDKSKEFNRKLIISLYSEKEFIRKQKLIFTKIAKIK